VFCFVKSNSHRRIPLTASVSRARETGAKTIFWLDPERAHDTKIIEKVEIYLKEHDTSGLDIEIMKPTHGTSGKFLSL